MHLGFGCVVVVGRPFQSQVPGEGLPAAEDGLPAQTGWTGRGCGRGHGQRGGQLKDTERVTE